MSKYKNCEGRFTENEKQSNQRKMDSLFKAITGRTNPPRKKEEDSFYNTIRYLENSNTEIRKELAGYMGIR